MLYGGFEKATPHGQRLPGRIIPAHERAINLWSPHSGPHSPAREGEFKASIVSCRMYIYAVCREQCDVSDADARHRVVRVSTAGCVGRVRALSSSGVGRAAGT